MKAVTIRNPWAWLIVNGVMDVIMSTTNEKYRGPLLIYSAAVAGSQEEFDCATENLELFGPSGMVMPGRNSMNNDGLVGMVDIVDVIPPNCLAWEGSPWFIPERGYGVVVKNSRVLNFVRNQKKKPDIIPNFNWIMPKNFMEMFDVEEPDGNIIQTSGAVLLQTLVGEKQK